MPRKKSKSQNWRRTRDYRIWRVKCIRRDKVCVVCGSRQNRHVHHLESGAYNPELRFDPDNGVVLCGHHHLGTFHGLYKGSTRKKTTKKDFIHFMKMIKQIKNETLLTH